MFEKREKGITEKYINLSTRTRTIIKKIKKSKELNGNNASKSY